MLARLLSSAICGLVFAGTVTSVPAQSQPQTQQPPSSREVACADPNSNEAFQACIERGERAGHRGKGAKR